MKETNDIKEFTKVINAEFGYISMFDFIKLIKLSKKHGKAISGGDVYKAELAEKSMTSFCKKLFGDEFILLFNNDGSSYTAAIQLSSGASNLASGKGWGIPTGN
jgi:hypothetical protein